jgi:dGTPase
VAEERILRAFLMERMYRHHRLNRMTSKARRVVGTLFEQFLSEPNTLPEAWRALALGRDKARTARLVSDYIAGMTDRYALEEHARLFDLGRLT